MPSSIPSAEVFILNEYLKSMGAATPEYAARNLIKLPLCDHGEDHRNTPENRRLRLWDAILQAGAEYRAQHGMLIQLIKGVVDVAHSGRFCSSIYLEQHSQDVIDDAIYAWAELRDLPECWERKYGMLQIEQDESQEFSNEAVKRFLVFSEFSARLCATEFGVVPLMEAYVAVRDALETRIVLPRQSGGHRAINKLGECGAERMLNEAMSKEPSSQIAGEGQEGEHRIDVQGGVGHMGFKREPAESFVAQYRDQVEIDCWGHKQEQTQEMIEAKERNIKGTAIKLWTALTGGTNSADASSTADTLRGSALTNGFPSDSVKPHPALLREAIKILSGILWIPFAGSGLYRECKEPLPIKGEWSQTLRFKTELWDGRPGFSTERWEFWKQRLEWIVAQPEFGKAVRGQAKAKLNNIRMMEIHKDWGSRA